jgi:hypothetical protein
MKINKKKSISIFKKCKLTLLEFYIVNDDTYFMRIPLTDFYTYHLKELNNYFLGIHIIAITKTNYESIILNAIVN